MADVELHVADAMLEMTLAALLRAAGHAVHADRGDVLITDDPGQPREALAERPVWVLAGATQLNEAVAAMQRGARGYIFLPLVPGEAELAVARSVGAPVAAPVPEAEPLRPLGHVEREHITRVLRACKGNRAKAARVLGIGRNTLWRKLKQYEQEDASSRPDDALHD